MSKDFCNFQIEIPCKDCPMTSVCSVSPSLKRAMHNQKYTKDIKILDGDDSIKMYNVPIPSSNKVDINLYIMCKYRSNNSEESADYNFRYSIPCLDCTFSKHCKYGPCYLALPDLKNAFNFRFNNYEFIDISTNIGGFDNLSYFLSVRCDCKGGLNHDST